MGKNLDATGYAGVRLVLSNFKSKVQWERTG
jgi:hypothetical protein